MRVQCAHEKLEDVHQKQRGTEEFAPKGQQKTQMIYIGLTLWEDHPLIVDSLRKTLIKVGGIFPWRKGFPQKHHWLSGSNGSTGCRCSPGKDCRWPSNGDWARRKRVTEWAVKFKVEKELQFLSISMS